MAGTCWRIKGTATTTLHSAVLGILTGTAAGGSLSLGVSCSPGSFVEKLCLLQTEFHAPKNPVVGECYTGGASHPAPDLLTKLL